MNKNVLVLGGSGFIGNHLICKLVEKGYQITAVVRSEESIKKLNCLKKNIVVSEQFSDGKLRDCFRGQDAVINLIGVLHDEPSNSFQVLHEELPRKILRNCSVENVPQLIHMSALPASSKVGPSRYLYSRGRGEDRVFEEVKDVVVSSIRPSIVFGADDHFFSSFAKILRWVPVLPLACPNSRFAPVFVGDVVDSILVLLADPKSFNGKRIDLCGPQIYTLRELIEFIAKAMKRKTIIVNLPDSLARVQASVLEMLPGKKFTMDNYLSLQVDSTSTQNGCNLLGINPKSVEEVMKPLLNR